MELVSLQFTSSPNNTHEQVFMDRRKPVAFLRSWSFALGRKSSLCARKLLMSAQTKAIHFATVCKVDLGRF